MIELEKAYEIISENCPDIKIKDVAVEKATGFVCMEDMYSKINMPPFNKSAMDGYAFKYSDGVSQYKNAGILPAGGSSSIVAGEGECVSIMTGAPLPSGTDTVIMIEATEKEGKNVTFRKVSSKGSNVCYKGEDIKEGDLIFKKGQKIKSSDIALITASGFSKLKVSAKPEISVLNTGSEIIEPGNDLKYGQIYNTNGIMLRAMSEKYGLKTKYLGIAEDEKAALSEKITEGLKSDIFLISGGVSMGEFDLIPDILQDLGVKKLFHKVRIKPGKPVFFGKKDNCLVFGLPGNPLSNFVGFELFVRTAVRKITGEKQVFPVYLKGFIQKEFHHKGNRKNFYPALIKNDNGMVKVDPVISNGSADIFSLSKANGFLIADINKRNYQPGDEIEYICF
ncbi:MAG: molybdopterin molybdotransferase MoeA [Candidatus Delongbacteria bacterium]